ncbi:MAG: hypothetical protein V1891_01855 [bacterium]
MERHWLSIYFIFIKIIIFPIATNAIVDITSKIAQYPIIAAQKLNPIHAPCHGKASSNSIVVVFQIIPDYSMCHPALDAGSRINQLVLFLLIKPL